MTPPGEPEAPTDRRMAPERRVLVLATCLFAASALLGLTIGGFHRFDTTEWPVLVALAVAFGLSEKLVFHVEAKNEAISYTPSDIALSIGLLFVSPLGLLASRLVGASLGIWIFRRAPAIKWFFNLAAFSTETVLAVWLFDMAVDSMPEPSPLVWIGLAASLFVALLVAAITIAAAISCFEGEFWARARNEIANSPVFHLPNTLLASTIAMAMLISVWQGVVVATLAPALWGVVRSHGALLHRYSDLNGAHQFSRRVGDQADIGGIVESAVTQIGENLRAGSVALRVWDRDGGCTDASSGDPKLLELLPTSPSACTNASVTAPAHDYLEHVLRDERGVLGCVAIAERRGVNPSFDDDDLARLDAMGQQLSVAVRKGQLHEQIQHEATHDRLTGLVNRSYFEAWINGLAATQRSAVLFVDLDRFKEVNDAFGHHAGDALLRMTAKRIRQVCPDDCLVARFGGDEFAVLAPQLDAVEAHRLGLRIADALDETFPLPDASVAVSSSIGISLRPEHGSDATALIRRADIAMYDAKNRFTRLSVYTDDLEEDDSSRLALLVDLRNAIADGDLEVHYQPQVDLATDSVVAAEALVRWHHEEHGNVSPEVFVGLAEQSGLIEPLTDCVLAKSMAAAAEWDRRGWNLNVAVNISARSLLDQRLIEMVQRNLSDTGLDPRRLMLEITESTMMVDTSRTHRMLSSLNALGIAISIDDFGTGYSSLGSLRHLPVTELKIDRSFIMNMEQNHHDAVIVRSTVDLAHNLGLVAVAEGVETESVWNRLTELGCDRAQGYGISRPMPIDAFRHWFQRRLETHPTETVPAVDQLSPANDPLITL